MMTTIKKCPPKLFYTIELSSRMSDTWKLLETDGESGPGWSNVTTVPLLSHINSYRGRVDKSNLTPGLPPTPVTLHQAQ